MHADGYAGFNDLFGDAKASEVACMAHIRRKFVDVQQSQGSAIAEEAIKRIAALYGIEKAARGNSPEERVAMRRKKPNRSLMTWKHGCKRCCPKSPASRHWPKLSVTR